MTAKRDHQRKQGKTKSAKSQKLKKETLKDLSPAQGAEQAVKGGFRSCGCTS